MKRIVATVLILLLLIVNTGCGNLSYLGGMGAQENDPPLDPSNPQPTAPHDDVSPLPTPATQNTPERAPSLYVSTFAGDSPKQRVQAVQLTTSWMVIHEDGTGSSYEADSPHALQLRADAFNEATLHFSDTIIELELEFSDNYPPQSISAHRWNAKYAKGEQNISDVVDLGESVELMKNVISASEDGHDYVYEIYAKWSNGSSYYTFRMNSAPSAPDIPDPESPGFSVDIWTDSYRHINAQTSSDIKVDYLQLKGLPDRKTEQSINQALKDMAWLDGVTPMEESLSYEMQCDYTLIAGRYLSVRYLLFYYHQSAAHPWRSLTCKTIDLQTGQEIGLAEIMAIDELLLQKLDDREFDVSKSDIVGADEGVLEECDYEGFYRQIYANKNFTLGEDYIGFVVYVPHAVGDYWVLAFPYYRVSESLHAWFANIVKA